MIKILIADDHQMFIDGLSALAESLENVNVLGGANDGVELLKLLETQPADLILMDYNMPIMDGLECTRIIIDKYPEIKVLMLTMHHSKDYIAKALKAGAHGYILKNTGKEELQEAIEAIIAGDSYFSKEVTEQIMQGLQRKKKIQKDYQISDLTEREKEVLILITQEMTTNEIAEALFISKHTVETHRKNLISKLNVRNVTGLVKYAVQQGLVD